ncbi:DAK2 domain-containing protein [Mycolicibacterium sp. CBMA 226]|uniref:DAK2 domain-containing protein n=1 Tax=Mycolicibacterium sp. CBMA 226 TaxID=2606611 RepID=UPI0012DF467C|nr:DAK2 domain-containing protein [Mycolicibacterium sp. CBMA 226]MUL75360.1 DAK2 domain-containing protein [Mycolicibacterium sp. CBMA 226]
MSAGVGRTPRPLDGIALRDWAHTAVLHLIAHTDEINRLNVYPVADSDTGTNMLFTMRAAAAQADEAVKAAGNDVVAVSAALSAGALHGARGNSGVILSQILRGLADVVAEAALQRGEDGECGEVTAPVFTAALHHAQVLAVASVGQTVPGTIVSVLQAAALEAENHDGVTDLAAIAAAVSDAAAAALERTTDQLDVLAEAGVVDAGGRGLLVLLDALTTTLSGDSTPRPQYQPGAGHPRADDGHGHDHHEVNGTPPQFEVMYLLGDCHPDNAEVLRTRLLGLGESVAIAAAIAGAQYSVHVHADDAGAAIEAALDLGTISRIQVTALIGAAGARPSGGWSRDRAVLAIVDGDGARELFSGEGAHVLRPADGPISAQQFLAGLVGTGAAQIMVLPNGFLAAEELVAGCATAISWGMDVVPVPAGSMVQGLAALAVHDATRQAVDDGYTMARAAAAARHGSVRIATEAALTWAGMCRPGDGLGIAGDEVLIVGHDLVSAASGLIDLLLSSGGELVTVLTGAGVDAEVGAALAEHVRQEHLAAELVTYHTGHRGDALLIGVE